MTENWIGACGHTRNMEPSDDELWARSRADNADAFGMLFERHSALIYNYCYRRLGNWAATQELVSTVFLEAWRRRDKELPPDKVLPWLYGIATNVLRNQRRSKRRYAAALRRLPAIEAEPDIADAAGERIDYRRQTLEAIGLLRALPKGQQDVFFLCVGMELSYEDAAFALQIPIGTVRSRLSGARARLRELNSSSGNDQGESTHIQEARQHD
jgi:RNA polymerase sigma-70 factor, ECF subfamily